MKIKMAKGRLLHFDEILAAITVLLVLNPLAYGKFNPIWTMGVSIIWIVFALIANWNAFAKAITDKVVVASLVFPIVMLINSVFREDIVFEKRCILDVVCILIGRYYYFSRDYKKSTFLVNIMMAYLMIISIVTVFQLRTNSNIARLMASDLTASYATPFTGGYGSVYCLVFLLIALFGVVVLRWEKRKNITRFIPLLAAYAFFILRAQYVMAVLITFVGFLLVFFNQNKKATAVTIFLFFLALIVYFFSGFHISNLLFRIAENFPVTSFFHTRLIQLGNLMKSVSNGSIANVGQGKWIRFEIYKTTFDAFIKNPLWGIGNQNISEIGNHSSILDLFGGFGLLSGSVILLSKLYMLLKIKIASGNRYRYVQSIISGLFVLFMLINNADRNEFTLVIFGLIPLLLDYYAAEEKYGIALPFISKLVDIRKKRRIS